MRAIFLNFLFVIFLMGVLTRLLNFLLKNKVQKPYIATFFISLVCVFPLVSVIIGFDVAISIYLVSLLIWLLIDHLHFQVEKRK